MQAVALTEMAALLLTVLCPETWMVALAFSLTATTQLPLAELLESELWPERDSCKDPPVWEMPAWTREPKMLEFFVDLLHQPSVVSLITLSCHKRAPASMGALFLLMVAFSDSVMLPEATFARLTAGPSLRLKEAPFLMLRAKEALLTTLMAPKVFARMAVVSCIETSSLARFSAARAVPLLLSMEVAPDMLSEVTGSCWDPPDPAVFVRYNTLPKLHSDE